MPIKQYIKNKIAWVLSQHDDCPDFLNYYDIKDSLSDLQCIEIRKHFSNKSNLDNVLLNKNISDELLNILEELSSVEMYERRRISLIHGLIEFPSINKIVNKDQAIEGLENLTHKEERSELQYIFLNSFVIALSSDEPFGDHMTEARRNLKLISDTHENGYEEDSLYSQFMNLMELSEQITRTSDHFISQGKTQMPSKEQALKILLDFTDYDFQDAEWVGGYREIGRTYQQSRTKRKVLENLNDLRELSFNDSLKFFS